MDQNQKAQQTEQIETTQPKTTRSKQETQLPSSYFVAVIAMTCLAILNF